MINCLNVFKNMFPKMLKKINKYELGEYHFSSKITNIL